MCSSGITDSTITMCGVIMLDIVMFRFCCLSFTGLALCVIISEITIMSSESQPASEHRCESGRIPRFCVSWRPK